METGRSAALDVLLQMERGGGYSTIALEKRLRASRLGAQDRSFCTALCKSVTERRLTADHVLRRYLSRPLERLDAEVRCILRMGVCQLLYFRSVPARAAVDESVRLCAYARKTSAKGLVNGVLRSFLRDGCALPPCKGDELDRLSVLYSAPRPLIALLREALGPERAGVLLQRALEPAPLCVRVNTLRTSADALGEALSACGVQVKRSAEDPDALFLQDTGSLEKLGAFRDGLFHVQDLVCQLCARAVDAQPGMRVLDVCAAPGGKGFSMAERMEGRGKVVCCDIHPHKVELVRQGAERLGLSSIIPMVQDATVYNEKLTGFDRVLCDVPCSGLGILRRKPEIKYKDLVSFAALPPMQYKILEISAQYCKENGILVYATCTLLPAENEEVAGRFLKEHPEFEPAPHPLLGGVWQRTFLPGEMGDGFFLARLRRRGVPGKGAAV
ncbi:MAG: 16S rRNA (cytosine(967)-C(5))-methyltransferase RsmB [Provencibacterium sp.]|jgi:16S rRNA (cytosine967-C5)-methyltransferase|nr:16S rRNA (cytosine(967)-C(5))-methyltransferase RsmB [Provencibacterium sp.]